MKNRLQAALIAAAIFCATTAPARADNYGAVVADHTTQTFAAKLVSGILHPLQLLEVLIGGTPTPIQGGQQSKANSLPVALASDPDIRAASATITAADSATTSISGQGSVAIISGTPTAGSSITWPVNGHSSVTITVSGVFVAAAPIEISQDGVNFVTASSRLRGNGSTQASVTGPGVFQVDVPGMAAVRLRASAYTSGTLTAGATASSAPGITQVVNPVRLSDANGAVTGIASNPLFVSETAALPAGTNLLGKVGIDQTTPGTTNGVAVNSSALPTGAATSANQTTEISSLASIATNTTGAATAAAQATANTSLSTIATNTTGASTAAAQATGNTSLGTIATNTTGVATAANQTTGNSSLSTIATNTTGVSTASAQATANTTLSTIATNTTGAATAANQTTGNSSLSTIATNTTGVSTAANQTSANTKLDQLHTDMIAATPAGENHLGEVGGNTTTITVAQTVTASSAYAAGNAVGALMTLSTAARVAGGSGLVQSVVNYAKSAQTTPVDVFLFNANPTGSTCTDKTAFDLAAADFDKLIGVAHVSDWTAAGTTRSFGQAQSLAMPFALASGTTIYACAVTRSTPTYTSTSDISFGFRILRN